MNVAVLILIGLTVAALPPAAAQTAKPPQARSGPVRIEGRAVADAGGPFNALGASLFWGAWGYKFDRARLERNLASLKAAGVDYVRILGTVGGAGWEDRQADPRWPDYDAIIAGTTDLAYDRYGLRIQWTIFGGAPFTEEPRIKTAVVDRFARMARGREAKLFAFEIANEAWQNGFEGLEGLRELRRLGQRLNARTSVLVALSAPPPGTACETYAGAGMDVMTVHYPRPYEKEGWTRPLRRSLDFPSSYDAKCRGQLPAVILNNEPIGPESTVEAEDSPGRIAAAYVLSFLAGNASYVFHSGPGIRGGGKADRTGELRRHSNFDELPTFAGLSTALREARGYLPAGVANWQRHAPHSMRTPLHGFDRLIVATSGSQLAGIALDVREPVTLTAGAGLSLAVRQTATGKIVQRMTAKSGQNISLSAGEALALIGLMK